MKQQPIQSLWMGAALSPAGFDAYYNRGCMGEVADILDETYGYILQYAKLNIDVGNTPEAYKQYLGKSLLYIDTSFRTPMNRARTEAFLSGCCVIQVEGAHDLQYWAKAGENIVLVPDNPEEIARVIAEFLHDGYLRAIAIGQKGRETALREFNYARYRNDWMNLLEQVTTHKRR
ncbi:MAG: glycosyltransferase [Tannerella sp.]|jgi:glycosyltransferase involved in cell wall biosynthesis|nr:glycosyltransferase [Tannerella sp.]